VSLVHLQYGPNRDSEPANRIHFVVFDMQNRTKCILLGGLEIFFSVKHCADLLRGL
jgi:hypothetical protein